MVTDKEQIKTLLESNFKVYGKVTISSKGIVNVKGAVDLTKKVSQLPIQFGTVSGNFWCNGASLTTLVGSPTSVGGYFLCEHNKLINLKGAPTYVGSHFWCTDSPLSSLEGAPDHVGEEFWCTYNAHLPLLRLVIYNRVLISHAPDPVKEIMDKYVGQDKMGALKAAAELIKAGYKENARW